MNAEAWLAELEAHRPDLVAHPSLRIDDPGWQALVIRPRYDDELIGSPTATYDLIVAREYDASERADDEAAYAGIRVGPDVSLWDDRGISYKVFFELEDFHTSLDPERFLGFAYALDSAGFVGDFKFDLRPGQVRFQYNNVIVHAPSMAMAECAEAVGSHFFAAHALRTGRGVDARVDGRPVSWHHLLLMKQLDRLPAAVKDFVRYDTSRSASPCPNARWSAVPR